MTKSCTIRITGKVQGVGFRFYTHKKANELGVKGFVKNMRDGSVYCEVEGSEEKVDEFMLWIHHGPEWARVEKVLPQEKPHEGFDFFVII
jgi:acylphosphatase